MKKIALLPHAKRAILEGRKFAMLRLIDPQPDKTEFATKLTDLKDGKVGALFTDVHTHPVDGQIVFPDDKAGDVLHFIYKGVKIFIQVTSVRPVRISEIKEKDAVEQGYLPDENRTALDKLLTKWRLMHPSVHVPDPWVWVIKFQRVHFHRG